MMIKMEKVLVTSYSISGSTSDDRPMEEIAFNYDKITFTYIPPNDPGGKKEYSDSWKVGR